MFALLASLAEKRLSRLQVPELQQCKLTLPDLQAKETGHTGNNLELTFF